MISYRLTDEDILPGNNLWWRYRNRPSIFVLAYVLIGIGMGVYSHYIDRNPLLTSVATAVVTPIFCVLALRYILPRLSRRQTLQYFQQASSSGQATSVEWDDTHIAFRQPDAFQRLPWRDIKAWRENDDMIVLMRIGPMFNPIPKRALDAQQLESLRACMARAGIS